MRIALKKTGDFILGIFNFNIRRKLNGRKVIVPVRSGIKVTISGEKWLSGILKILFNHSDGTFLDIGANLGQTLIKVKTIDPYRNYIGLEPNPSCIFYLQHLVLKNNWKNITLVPVGIYPFDCLLSLVGEHDTHGSSTVIDDFKTSSRFSSRISKLVPLLSFSTIQQSIPDIKISFIKIDVEGAELEVMESLSYTIRHRRPIIILEVWHNYGDPLKTARAKKLNNMLVSLNYTVFSWINIQDKPYYTDFKEAKLGDYSSENYVLLPQERQDEIKKVIKCGLDI